MQRSNPENEPLLEQAPAADPKANKKQSLLTIPNIRRGFEYAGKILFAVIVGASILVSIAAILATLHIALLIALIGGGVIFAAKEMIDAYKAYKNEQKALEKLKDSIAESIYQLEKELERIDDITALFEKRNELNFEEKEQLYAYLFQLIIQYERLRLYKDKMPATHRVSIHGHEVDVSTQNVFQHPHIETLKQYKDQLYREINVEGNEVRQAHNERARQYVQQKYPTLNEDTPKYQQALTKAQQTPLSQFSPRLPEHQHNISSWFKSPGTFFRKLANRALTFVGGASMGASVGIAVVALTLGAAVLTGPIGWVVGGIIIGAVAAGAAAVAIDHLITRSQTKKIAETNYQVDKLRNATDNLEKRALNIHAMTQKYRPELTQERDLARQQLEQERLEKQRLADENARLAEEKQRLAEEAAKHKQERKQYKNTTREVSEKLLGKEEAYTHLTEEHGALKLLSEQQKDELAQRDKELKRQEQALEKQKAYAAQLQQEKEAREQELKEKEEAEKARLTELEQLRARIDELEARGKQDKTPTPNE